MRHKGIIGVVGFAGVYLSVLVAPAMMGSVVDESRGSFLGPTTAIGGKSMTARAVQTLAWAKAGRECVFLAEVGPGRGVLARVASQDPGCQYFAIDMDASALASVPAAGKYHCRVPPMPGDMPPVDVIVAENVLEHCTGYAEARALLVACRDTLMPGGRLILRCPDIRYLKGGFWDGAQDHQYVTSLRRMGMLCRECGFSIERCGLALDHWDGLRGMLAYQVKRCWPWRAMHDLFYEPWQTSPWSKLAEKVPHAYVVARLN